MINNTAVKYLVGGTAIVCAILFCWYFFNVIAYVFIAAVVSFIGQPIVNLLGRVQIGKWRPGNAFKAALALASIWFFIILFLSFVVPLVYNEFAALKDFDSEILFKNLDVPIANAENYLKNMGLAGADIDIKARIMLAANSVFSLTGITGIFGKMAGALSTIAIGVFAVSFIAFFFLKDSSLFTKMLLTLIPERYEIQLKSTLSSCERLLVRYIVGLLFEMLAVMLLNTLGLSIVGLQMRHALVIAMITGLMIVIPYIGPIIGMLLGLSIAVIANIDNEIFMSDLLYRLIYIEVIFLVTQGVDSFFFQPYIYGNSVHAHPLEIFIVILLAGSMAGVPGMILAIPCYTIFRVILVEFFSKYNVVQKLTKSIRNDIDK